MEKNNKLIAEFMGVDQVDIDYAFNEHGQLKYHLSWDWLMPAINKCFDVAEDGQMIDIMHHLQVAEMDSTYDAVINLLTIIITKTMKDTNIIETDIYNIILIHTARTWERIRMSKPNQEMIADNIRSTELIEEISTDILSNYLIQEFIQLKKDNSVPDNFWDREGDGFSDTYIEISNRNYYEKLLTKN